MLRRKEFSRVQHLEDPIYAMIPGEPELEDGVLYIMDGPRYVEYKCPCGCGNVVMLPYYTGEEKQGDWGWKLEEHGGRATLQPSVFSRLWPCGSHYFIRDNRIDWCG